MDCFIQCKWPDKNDKNVALCGRNNFEYITNASNGQQTQKRVTNKPKISIITNLIKFAESAYTANVIEQRCNYAALDL